MDNISIETIWFDENIQNKENKRYFKQLKSIFKKVLNINYLMKDSTNCIKEKMKMIL